MPGTSFDSTKIYLQELLDQAGKGKSAAPGLPARLGLG